MNANRNITVDLEDNHEDILAKSVRGLGIGKAEISERIGIDKQRVESVLLGGIDGEIVSGMAEILNLDAEKLLVISSKEWSPAPVEMNCLEQFNLPFGSMRVNAYLTCFYLDLRAP